MPSTQNLATEDGWKYQISRLEQRLKDTEAKLQQEQHAGLANFANYRRHVDLLVDQRNNALELLGRLANAMHYWGSQQDGIPEEMYADWKAAREMIAAHQETLEEGGAARGG